MKLYIQNFYEAMKISTIKRDENPIIIKKSWSSPEMFLDLSRSNISNTTTYKMVPPAKACNTATVIWKVGFDSKLSVTARPIPIPTEDMMDQMKIYVI